LGASPTKAKLGSSRRTPPFFAGVEGGAAPLAFWIYKIHEPLQWPQAGFGTLVFKKTCTLMVCDTSLFRSAPLRVCFPHQV